MNYLTKICQNCKGTFYTRYPKQTYCSAECRRGAQYRKLKAEEHARELEQQEQLMQEWRERYKQGLKKSVCLYCMKFEWKAKPTLFCSDGCRILHNGG